MSVDESGDLGFGQKAAKQDFMGGVVAINKESVADNLKRKKDILYNFLIAEYVVTTLFGSFGDISKINLHLDRSMSTKARAHFDSPVLQKMKQIPEGFGDFCLDSAYLSRKVCSRIVTLGRMPFIKPKKNSAEIQKGVRHGRRWYLYT